MSGPTSSSSSSSSSSSGGSGGASSADYRKLAAHYSRIKTQHGVLKKAVVAEQARSGGLEAKLEVAEKRLRGAMEEIDRQGFENGSLKARIEQMRQQMNTMEDDVASGALGGGSR